MSVRTTIEINDRHRARLLEIAGQRGQKGFSDIVGEALEWYLGEVRKAEERRKAAAKLRGCLKDDEAVELRAEVRKLRAAWR
jgi:Arc/MetJ family transcription regulator